MTSENITTSPSRGDLTTEQRNPRSENLSSLSISQTLDLINSEDATIAQSVKAAGPEICQAIELIVPRLRAGGRLIYVGAGTSGRLGVLDAAECPPTFMTNPNDVQGVIAGGNEALVCSVEGAEDDPTAGAAKMIALKISDRDVVFGISTSGTAKYVHGALHEAKHLGVGVIMLSCVSRSDATVEADVSIRVITGPEVLTGSTRMKAGTATKMVLNMISTITMVQLGKTYNNLMVDLNTKGNTKLVDRGIRIIQEVTKLDRDNAQALLDQADGLVKVAIVMHMKSVNRTSAEALLAGVDGHLDRLL